MWKKKIIENGRPCPDMHILTPVKLKKTEENICTRHFRKELYNISDWLCGCDVANKFFCWSCLLFSTKKNVWNNQGYDDLNHLNTAVKKHTESEIHITGYFKLKTFLSTSTSRIDTLLDNQRKIDIKLHNEKVTKNREILKRLINAVCFLAKQELPLRGHNENNQSVNKGNYMELLISIQEFDPLLQEHLETSTIFRGTSVSIQNDLISSISDVIKNEIFDEIQNSQCVAIMLDETSDISNKSQLSTVLRYFSQNEQKIVERFLGFDDVSADKTADALFNHVNQVVDKFKMENKLVAQTYDGVAVMSGHLNGLQSKVLDKYPKALFTHCYAHVINLVFQRSLECNKELKIFFKGLNSLPTFFFHSPKRLKALSEFMSKKLPTLATTRWNFTSRLVHTVYNHQKSLVDFFCYVSESDDFDNITGITAKGFANFLQEFKNIFVIKMLSNLLAFTDVLFNILQTKNFDILYCSQKVLEFQNQLKERDNFDSIWLSVTESSDELFVQNRNSRHNTEKSGKDYFRFRRLYFEIIDNIQTQMDIRFKSFEKLQYFNLLNPNKIKDFAKKENFPIHLIKKLQEIYGNYFNYGKLQNEFLVWYTLNESAEKGPIEIMNYLSEMCLKSGFSEVYKLAQLISTIPTTTASIERSFSSLKRIHTYCRSTQTQEGMNNLSLISIEKELLFTLRTNKNQFYENVIKKFVEKERRIEFEFK